MNVNLPPDLNDFVAEQLREGGYSNQSEVIRDALRLLRNRAEARRDLCARLDRGIADADAGRTKPFTRELLVETADRVQARIQKRQAAKAD
jgi:antitoxin ParD1/3/4